VALENIEILQREDVCGHVRLRGTYFEERMATLRDLRILGNTRGIHFMVYVENVVDKESKALLPPEADIAKPFAQHAQQRGLLVRPIAHHNVISPPLILTREQVDEIVDTLHLSIEAATRDLEREGFLR